MKRADLRVGMHVKIGKTGEGYVWKTEPWIDRGWRHKETRSSPRIGPSPRDGSGVLVRRDGELQVIQIYRLIPMDEAIADAEREKHEREALREGAEHRYQLWHDEVHDLQNEIARVLETDATDLKVRAGRFGPMVSIDIGTIRRLVERASQ